MRMLGALRTFLARRKPLIEKITALHAADGAIVLSGIASPRDRIPINQIEKIVAYKRDMGTSDLVCFLLIYRLSDQSVWHVTLHEDMPGFLEVDRALAELPGFNTRWRDLVIKPAFRTNETVVFEATGPTAVLATR